MLPRSESLIWDIAFHADFIIETTAEDDHWHSSSDSLTRHAVDRALQICSDRMISLEQTDPACASTFTDSTVLIGLRPKLVVARDGIDPNDLRTFVDESVPRLFAESLIYIELEPEWSDAESVY